MTKELTPGNCWRSCSGLFMWKCDVKRGCVT
uniref:Uncharacterized protein n=1 Tax=Anguilla anguilla TaxID=7936 RepID=A0A0E9SQX7_ANGAN